MKRAFSLVLGTAILLAAAAESSVAAAAPRCSSNGSVCLASNAGACCTAVCNLAHADDTKGVCAAIE